MKIHPGKVLLALFLFPVLVKGSGEQSVEIDVEFLVMQVRLVELETIKQLLNEPLPLYYIGTVDMDEERFHLLFKDRTSTEGGMPWTFYEKVKIPVGALTVAEPIPLELSKEPIIIAPRFDGRRVSGIPEKPVHEF